MIFEFLSAARDDAMKFYKAARRAIMFKKAVKLQIDIEINAFLMLNIRLFNKKS